jgi:hypothetical protein
MIENTNVKSKLVFDYRACRALLKRGMRVVDCKPLKTDKTKPVLVFEDTPEFEEALTEVMAELKAKDEAKKEPVEMAD